jgi:hypothetical protein
MRHGIVTLTVLITAMLLALVLAEHATAVTNFPNGEKYCGTLGHFPGVVAGKRTSCAFARNVARAYVAAGYPKRGKVRAYSPVTGRTYTMNCRFKQTQDSPYGLCTGANNARVKITS